MDGGGRREARRLRHEQGCAQQEDSACQCTARSRPAEAKRGRCIVPAEEASAESMMCARARTMSRDASGHRRSARGYARTAGKGGR